MNERIKDLIKAAGGIGHDDDGQELTPMLVGSGIEKFAELIVRECMSQIEEVRQIKAGNAGPVYTQGFEDGMFVAIRTIEKTFRSRRMNERIKELAGYVEKYISTTNFEGMPEDEMTYDEIFQKKFAELIVKECADICYHHSNAAGGVDTHFGYGYKDCGDDIKRNFGVEE